MVSLDDHCLSILCSVHGREFLEPDFSSWNLGFGALLLHHWGSPLFFFFKVVISNWGHLMSRHDLLRYVDDKLCSESFYFNLENRGW